MFDLLNNIHWLHAVNSKQKWEDEIGPSFLVSNSNNNKNKPLGIEVDIRYSEKLQRPVLAHDKISNDNNDSDDNSCYDSVEELCEYLLSLMRNSPSSCMTRTIILKLDIKERKAAEAILKTPKIIQLLQQLKGNTTSFSQNFSSVQIWFNVDVLPITPSKFVSIDGMSPLDVGYDVKVCGEIVQTAVQMKNLTIMDQTPTPLFDTFSLGWIGCGNEQVVSYNRDCCQKMLNFVAKNILEKVSKTTASSPPKITFAVRASFVVNDSEARRQLQNLIQQLEGSFLTFWRGRKEEISQGDFEFAREHFGKRWTIDTS